ncbi:MAG: hypothetical protein WBI41_00915 [Azovibrio sp.]|uniref:hypothetical protein n=1 Tax=Azovibrio sp. TaxID=1872673 RepID=UPI003C77A9E2
MSFLGYGVAVGMPGLLLARAMHLESHFLAMAAVVYAAIATMAQLHLPGLHPHPRFGLPNQITTLRAALTALFDGLYRQACRPAVPVSGWRHRSGAPARSTVPATHRQE